MYLTFFGFREKPFNLTPDPKFLYLNASYREALAALRYGINERKGFVSLIGEAGTGKTTLLRRLLAELGPDVRSVLILNPAVDFDELLVFILADLGHPPPPGTPKLQLLQALNAELLDTLARGGNVVVLVDEAQDLSIPVLEELRLLSNLETAKEKILQFVLAGQPELDGMLARPELRQLRQRIAVPARLRTLWRGEVEAYVAARISAAGGDARGLFTAAALRQLYRFSRGVPRLVNVACDAALVTAYAAGTRVVDRKIMREAIHDLRRGPHQRPAAMWRTRLATIAIAAAVGATMGLAASRFASGSFSFGRWRTSEPSPAIRRDAGTSSAPSALHDDATGSRDVAGGAPAVEAAPGMAGAPPDAVLRAEAQRRAPESAASAPPADRDTREPADAAVIGAAAEGTPAAGTAPVERAAEEAGQRADAPAPEIDAGSVAGSLEQKPPQGRQIFVLEGDDLTHIARREYGYATQALLEKIQRANPSIVDLDHVVPGQTITLPPESATTQTP